MLLLELKDATIIGISHDSNGKLNYFKCKGKLSPSERGNLTQQLYLGQTPESIDLLHVEELIMEIEGKKARHIWLESAGPERKELGFLSISELKAHFRTHPQR